jgi:hypothetical protein
MSGHTSWKKLKAEMAQKSRNRLIPVVNDHLVASYARKSAYRDTQHLHPSELSKKDLCLRAAWYKINKFPSAPERYTFDRLNVFEEGNVIHAKWQKWLKDVGILWGLWECTHCQHMWNAKSPKECNICGDRNIKYREVPIRDDEHLLLGHADGEIEDDRGRALIEIKSIGPGTVRWELPSLYQDYEDHKISLDQMWDNIKRPFASHLRQGNLYMHCRKINTMIYIYEWKPNQKVKEFELRYNADIVAPLLEACKTVMHHLEEDTVPDRPSWAYNKSCNGCKYCPFKETCWNGKADNQT